MIVGAIFTANLILPRELDLAHIDSPVPATEDSMSPSSPRVPPGVNLPPGRTYHQGRNLPPGPEPAAGLWAADRAGSAASLCLRPSRRPGVSELAGILETCCRLPVDS